MLPPLDIATLSPISLLDASMSSTLSAWYDASKCTDGSLSTLCASHDGTGEWLSIRVTLGTAIGYVAVYSRIDAYDYLMGAIEVWTGASAGETITSCGTREHDSVLAPGPYVVDCHGTEAEYVTVKRIGSGYLTLAEVEVYAATSPAAPPSPPWFPQPLNPPSPLIPPPLGPRPDTPPRPVDLTALLPILILEGSMSSTWAWPYGASAAIDNDLTTICASREGSSEWLSIRKAPATPIGHVAVFSRRDAYAYLLGEFEVVVGDSVGTATTSCGTRAYSSSLEPAPYVVDCGGAVGEYVTVRRVGVGFLTLAEVSVFAAPPPQPLGFPPSPPSPPATPPTFEGLTCSTPLGAQLSSTFTATYGAQYLIDGDRDTLVATSSAQGNWASITLNDNTPVTWVVVINRRDSTVFAAWLGTFEVWVGTATAPQTTLCDTITYTAADFGSRYIVQCPFGTVGSAVRVLQIPPTGETYLTLGELYACS